MTQQSAVEAWLEELRSAARLIHAIPVRKYERSAGQEVATEVRPSLEEQLARGLEVCTDAFIQYLDESGGVPPQPGVKDVARSFDSMFAAGDVAIHVADVLFMACWELKQKLTALTDTPAHDTQELYTRCCSARRRSVKALCAAEMVMCEAEGLTSDLAGLYRTELDCALAVRRAFSNLRAGVAHACLSQDTDKGRVRGIGIAVARLIGSDGYVYTRSDDRMRIRKLQDRALQWLRTGAADADEATDVIAEAAMLVEGLRDVNRRVELLDHDRRLAEELYEYLFGPTPRPVMAEPIIERLRPLRGRDDEIDGLLGLGIQPSAPWRALLGALRSPKNEPRWSTSRKIYLRRRG